MKSLKPISCQWCGKEILQEEQGSRRGRRRKYCSQSCRQRAYEQRNKVIGTVIPERAVIMTPESAETLRDRLYELRCLAEDVRTAAKEEASAEELSELCGELVELAKEIEKLR